MYQDSGISANIFDGGGETYYHSVSRLGIRSACSIVAYEPL